MTQRKHLLRLSTAVALLTSLTMFGSGFCILEQTSAGLGRGLAGMTADTTETGALYFNPAVGAWHDKDSLSIGTSNMHVNAKQKLQHDNTADGNHGGNAGGWERIPHLYYIHPYSDTIALGIGLSGTSGTATTWNKYWAGRYSALQTELAIVDFTPSLAFKVTDQLSLGLGLCVEYARITMSRAVANPYGGKDGQIKFKGTATTLGFTAGALYRPFKDTRIGLGYRSRMTHELELDARIRGIGDHKITGDADCDLKLPGILSVGIQQDLNDDWTIMADIAWTHGKVMDDMTVEFHHDALGETVHTMTGAYSDSQDMSWEDSFRYALGAEYRFSEKLTLRCGTAYDQTPIKDKYHRYASLPDLDRVWLTCGFSYQLTDYCKMDIGYVHIFFVKDDMDCTLNNGQHVRSRIKGDCDILSTALTFTF